MLARVRRLEAVRAPASPIVREWGSFETFEGWANDQIATGVLDSRDFPIVVICLARWEREKLW